MPDWFYRTVSQPVLFKLPAVKARSLALGLMGQLARLPFGSAVIDFMGHMRPDEQLRCTHHGIEFATAVGLGPGLDATASALPALARFGFGFLEVGPISIYGHPATQPLARRIDQEAIWSPDPPEVLSLASASPRLVEASRLGLPLIVRLYCSPGADPGKASEECVLLIRDVPPQVQFFSLPSLAIAIADRWSQEQWTVHLRMALEAGRPLLLCVPCTVDAVEAEPFIEAALSAGVVGLMVDGSVSAEGGGRLIGLPARVPALATVLRLRQRHGAGLFLIASGGVHEPADALALRDAGADLVQVDSGLVFSGPGLPKRINDLLLFEATRNNVTNSPVARAAEKSWFWTFLMGAGMLFGSVMALVIAATRVVLPYDEAFLGMSREQLAQVNSRLLPFMAHDRVCLAGTMIAIGVMYAGLSWFGVRRGLHWAQLSIFASAFTGFASFFSFLGFGYLDPFHAFVTVALLQLLLLGVHAPLGTHTPSVAPPLRGDAAWRCSLWGQLLLIVHGGGLLGAGLVISAIGMTHVFVHEDLEFMQTTADVLVNANPRLVPVVAHDRATFGGMLISSGLIFLLPAMWGYRNGSAWLWWTTVVAGLLAYVSAIGVHFAVGYRDAVHLAPAFAGMGLFGLGLGLSYSFLCNEGVRKVV